MTILQTKYGPLKEDNFNKYKRSVIGRIYAILPMKEEGANTVTEYIESLNRELVKNIDIFGPCEHILSVVCLLEHLISEDDHAVYRKEVLHCCSIMSRIGEANV